jgi:hypothetical protein
MQGEFERASKRASREEAGSDELVCRLAWDLILGLKLVMMTKRGARRWTSCFHGV